MSHGGIMLSTLYHHRRTIFLSLIISFILGGVGLYSVYAQSNSTNKVIIYLFWGDGCPHCAEEKPFLEEMASKNPNIEIRAFEIWYDEPNRIKMEKMAEAYGFKPSGVPTTFIGDQYWVGFTDTIKDQMQEAVAKCLLTGCPDSGEGIIDINGQSGIEKTITPVPPVFDPASNIINVPIFGAIDLNAQSLTISTLLISFVDGVNPCSIWVLSMLMALVIHTGSRKKILIIGLIFLTVTAGIYAMFIAGLFSVLKIISFVGWIQVIVALVAFVFAVVNIKDYFWYQEGVSFTISDKNKSGILKKMRNVLASTDNIWSLAGATIVLAAGVSLVEFSCTAGFPVLWTNLLTAHNVSTSTFILLLILYMVIYQLDEMVIFGTVVVTLKASKLEEKHGRILKLIGGSLMLTLSIVMLINPRIMNDLSSSLLIFGIAFGFAILVLFLHRYLLPKFGIRIGSEMSNKKNRKKAYRKPTS
jgi:thiol-disulfide isomerase/thioredoxin